MVTIAILGRYAKKELIYAIYTALNQHNIEIELIIAMNELDFPASDVINLINGYRTSNVKRVRLHTEKEISSSYNYFLYVKKQMTGDYLLCLRDGASLVGLDSISRSIEGKGKIVIGRIILVNDKNQYIREVLQPEHDTIEKKLHGVLNGSVAGSVILPPMFIQSSWFAKMETLEELEEVIVNYLQVCTENGIVVNGEPLLRFNVEMEGETNEYVFQILEQNFELWQKQLENGELSLNQTGYHQLQRIIARIEEGKEQQNLIGKQIDASIQYIIRKQKEGKWDITRSDKAFIVYLIKLLNCLWGEEDTRQREIEELKENVNYRKKIKVVFAISEIFLWLSCYKSIYDAMKKDEERYEADIVYVPFEHHEINIDQKAQREEWENSGLTFRDAAEYQLDLESPDMIFFCKPYVVPDVKWNIEEVEKIIHKVIYVPYNMAIMDSTIQLLTYCMPLHFIAWKQLVFSRQYQKLIDENAYDSSKQLLVGHPKFDIDRKDLAEEEQKKILEIKKMANGRKIFLWNTRWMLHTERGECGTFLNYGIKFLEYIQSAEDIFVIWRPHPFFMDALKKYECYLSVLQMIENARNVENMYFDQGNSQWVSILSADVLISDPSSIIGSFVPMKKPIILTMLKEEETVVDEIVYKVTSYQELRQQVADMTVGKDERKEHREAYIQNNYFLPEGGMSVGEKVVRYIEENLMGEN